MNDLVERDLVPELLPIARCRALLGDDAWQLSDDDVDAMRPHALAMAHELIDVFLHQPSIGVAELRPARHAKAARRRSGRESGRLSTERN